MPRFVLMTRLAPESLKDADVRRAMGRAWLKKVQTGDHPGRGRRLHRKLAGLAVR